jgi:hypothetical protein
MLARANVLAESKEFENRVTAGNSNRCRANCAGIVLTKLGNVTGLLRFPDVRRKRLIPCAVSGTQARDGLLKLDFSALPPAPETFREPEGQRPSNDDFGSFLDQAVREVSRRPKARYDEPTTYPVRFLHIPPC